MRLLGDILVKILETKSIEVLAIYQFGSFGTSLERPDSDIDLAILTQKPSDVVILWQIAQELSAKVQRDVDLLDLRSVSTVMRLQVVAYGERIYCADKLSCDLYEVMAYSSYARLNEARKEILEDIRDRGSVYG
jgi:uncharacterized protein